MSQVSKLTIKAYKDNKFSSSAGEFITSINPENLTIKSDIKYHVPIARPNLLRYRHSPPKLLSFSLLLDNTGIIPGSSTISVMEQIKKLQDVTYNVQKGNNTPNYIRIIWGEIDFKGRLIDLDIVYSMFKMDGTLVRAEANLSILEEIPTTGHRKEQRQGHKSKNSQTKSKSKAKITPTQDINPNRRSLETQEFAATPNGMNGAYSGAPNGAYDGGPDNIYEGNKPSNNLIDMPKSGVANTPIQPSLTDQTQLQAAKHNDKLKLGLKSETNTKYGTQNANKINNVNNLFSKKNKFPTIGQDSLRTIATETTKTKFNNTQTKISLFFKIVKKIIKR